MKSLLFALLAAIPAVGQLWTLNVSDGVQMVPIMSCGIYDWSNGGRVVKEPDCLMVHVRPATPTSQMLVTIHVEPGEDGMPWVWQWVDVSESPWNTVGFPEFGVSRRIFAIDVEGFDADGNSVWWVTFPLEG